MENILSLKPYEDEEEKKKYYYITYKGNIKKLGNINKEMIPVCEHFIHYNFMEIILKFELKNIIQNKIKSYSYSGYLLFYLELLFIENGITFKLYYNQTNNRIKHQIIKDLLFNSSKQIVQNNSSKISNNIINIDDLINSTFGLNNFFGNCSLNSIIQIFLHTKCFLNQFLTLKNENNKPISFLFFKLLYSIKLKTYQKEFYEFCQYLNNKIKVSKNDPMYFCTKFIEILEEENSGKIINLFSGKKKINFENLNGFDEEEERFLFYIINLTYRETIENNVFKNKKLQIRDNYNYPKIIIQKETLIKEPEILMLNIECELNFNIFFFQIPETLKINQINYKLYAINEYNNLHSIA